MGTNFTFLRAQLQVSDGPVVGVEAHDGRGDAVSVCGFDDSPAKKVFGGALDDSARGTVDDLLSGRVDVREGASHSSDCISSLLVADLEFGERVEAVRIESILGFSGRSVLAGSEPACSSTIVDISCVCNARHGDKQCGS